MKVERFVLSSKYYGQEVVPDMLTHPEGKYVLYKDYELLIKHNEYQEALLEKHRGVDIPKLRRALRDLLNMAQSGMCDINPHDEYVIAQAQAVLRQVRGKE